MKAGLRFRSTLPLFGEDWIMDSRRLVWIALVLMVLAVLAGAAATTVLSAQASPVPVDAH